jgi:hypothetical protein
MAQTAMIEQLRLLLTKFAEHSPNPARFIELLACLDNPDMRRLAKGLFDQARRNFRTASAEGNRPREVQCRFEEVCAKVIYNLTQPTAPFDADSPYWIVPTALLAESEGIVPKGTVQSVVCAG